MSSRWPGLSRLGMYLCTTTSTGNRMVLPPFLGPTPIGNTRLVSVWTLRRRSLRRRHMRNSLLVSLVLPPRSHLLGVQIPTQTPLSLLGLLRPPSRSTMLSSGSFMLSARRLRNPRTKLLRLLALITPVDPSNNWISVVLGLAQQHCLVP